jgi:hypothetical protein
MFGANYYGGFYYGQAAASASAGPTTYNQAVSGALSFVGAAPTFAMTRSVAGALTFAGVIHKIPARRLTASLTPTGILAGVRALVRTLTAAALNFIGGNALYPDPVLYPDPGLYPYSGSLLIRRPAHLNSIFAPVGGSHVYPDPLLFPSPDEFPFGGAIIFQLNRIIPGALSFAGAVTTHGALTKALNAAFQPTSACARRVTRSLAGALSFVGGFSAQKSATVFTKALFASLRNAGALSTGINPGFLPEGGGGFGVPMPDDHFQRYKPTLRRQRMRV